MSCCAVLTTPSNHFSLRTRAFKPLTRISPENYLLFIRIYELSPRLMIFLKIEAKVELFIVWDFIFTTQFQGGVTQLLTTNFSVLLKVYPLLVLEFPKILIFFYIKFFPSISYGWDKTLQIDSYWVYLYSTIFFFWKYWSRWRGARELYCHAEVSTWDISSFCFFWVVIVIRLDLVELLFENTCFVMMYF